MKDKLPTKPFHFVSRIHLVHDAGEEGGAGNCRSQLDPAISRRIGLAMNLQTSNNTFRVVLLALLLMPCVSLSAAKRPNVVVLLADDLGWKDIGCYGGPVKTPTLDRLAAGGVRFTDFLFRRRGLLAVPRDTADRTTALARGHLQLDPRLRTEFAPAGT